MVRSAWLRSAGPGLVAVAAVGLLASTHSGRAIAHGIRRSGRGRPVVGGGVATTGARLPARRSPAGGVPAPGSGSTPSWIRAVPWPASGSSSAGRMARVGASWTCRPSPSAAGPFGGAIVVAADDGSISRVLALDVVAGCADDAGRRPPTSSGARRSPRTGGPSSRSGWTVDRGRTSAYGGGRSAGGPRRAAGSSRSARMPGSGGPGRRTWCGRRPGPSWRSSRAASWRAGRASWRSRPTTCAWSTTRTSARAIGHRGRTPGGVPGVSWDSLPDRRGRCPNGARRILASDAGPAVADRGRRSGHGSCTGRAPTPERRCVRWRSTGPTTGCSDRSQPAWTSWPIRRGRQAGSADPPAGSSSPRTAAMPRDSGRHGPAPPPCPRWPIRHHR